MQSAPNRVVVACAGARKTSSLIDEVLANPTQRILVTTYTNENLEQLRAFFVQKHGCVPANVTLRTWYVFLLQDCARPYQRTLTSGPRIRSVYFEARPRFLKKQESETYFFTKERDLYRDGVAEFAVEVNKRSGGQIIQRLERVYERIFIDELQDLSGYDYHLLDALFASAIPIVAIGDPRQRTYTTNYNQKNSPYAGGDGFLRWIQERDGNSVTVETRVESFRCNQPICDFADALYPMYPKTTSKNSIITGHDGVFRIGPEQIDLYQSTFSPVRLRHSKLNERAGPDALNFGRTKGRTYPRVLIYPTKPMLSYLATLDVGKAGDIPKFYVAVTRAMHSVAFVIDDTVKTHSSILVWPST